jgi:hypothetical protein
MGILRAKPDPKTGAMPQKQQPWDLSPALMANAQRATQDINEILGFSESEQLQGRDVSGKARRERKLEGSMSAYVFFDNLNQAIAQGGRIVNDLLPFIISDDERHMVLSKQDNTTKTIRFNQKMSDGSIINTLDHGDFDVEIDTGPSFAVQRDVSLEFLGQTLQAFPQAFPLIADIWAKNLDIEAGNQLIERFQSLVPPEILAKEKGEPPPPPQPNPQAMQMQMQMQMAQAELKNKQAEIQIKAQKLQLEKEQNDLEKVELQLKAQKIQMDGQMDVYNHQADLQRSKIDHDFERQKHYDGHNIEITKILSDLHKHHTTQEKQSSL